MYSAIDAAEVILAVLAYAPLVVLPGFTIASVTGALGWKTAPDSDKWLIGLVVGLAALPALESMTVRFLGLDAGLALDLILAMLGLIAAARERNWPRLPRPGLVILAVWLLVVLVELIDFDIGGGLHQSLLVYDMAKHAPTIRAIAASGAPPIDPYFFRPERSGYYYFFYTLPAILARFSGGLIDARAAFAGLAFWTGPGLFGLAAILLDRTRLVNDENRARVRRLVLALLSCTGLALIGMTIFKAITGVWLQQPDWWSAEVTTWVCGLLWVPEHLTALIASWIGLALLADEMGGEVGRSKRRLAPVALAAVCFATSFGASVWVTVVTVLTVIVWSIWLAITGRWRGLLCLVGAGMLALVIDAAAILDVLRNRHFDGLPVDLSVRDFLIWQMIVPREPLRTIGDFLLLPVNYGLEFGIFAWGTWVFWRSRPPAPSSELGRVLAIGAVTGLVVGSFVGSTVIFNDLPWRSMLFPQIACLVWTAVALDGVTRRQASSPGASWFSRLPVAAGVMLVVGYAGVAYALVCARLPSALFEPVGRFINASPAVDRDARAAYDWANVHLPSTAVLQHNPAPQRVFDFGLYSRNRVAVSDQQAMLYGAPRADALRRMDVIARLFRRSAPLASVRQVASSIGIDAFVVTAADPVWSDKSSWIWASPARFRNAHVRVIAVSDLDAISPSRAR